MAFGLHSQCNSRLLLLFDLSKAFAAIDGLVVLGLEGNAGLAAASGAGANEHFALTLTGIALGIAAGLATLGFVLETLFGVEFLLTGGENEFLAAVFALECLVLVHGFYLALV